VKRLLLALALITCTAPATAAGPRATAEPTATPSPTSAPIVLPDRPFVCSSTDLCYPRVFLSAAVVDLYDSESGLLGNQVDRLHWYDDLGIFLAGHAYITPMGAILQWQAGDDVVVYGQHYTVFGATYVFACVPLPVLTPAKIYLMTSATTDSCESGQHQNLVVMAH
jgi:hypothetical protein